MDWPLSTPIAMYAVETELSIEETPDPPPSIGGHLAQGADAVALRSLRARAVEAPVGGQFDGWIAIDGPADTFYEVVVADVLPYEDGSGIVPLSTGVASTVP
jgi:hypothetical protein